MLIRILAVGTRMPGWVDTAVAEYTSRMPADFEVQWKEIKAEPRNAGATATQWMAREAVRITQARPAGSHLVVLDERGADLTTAALAQRLRAWREAAQPVALVIGGPDGLDPSIKRDAAESIRLSSLTLPHPMVRVVLAEQLYRAWTILTNHPYHRT